MTNLPAPRKTNRHLVPFRNAAQLQPGQNRQVVSLDGALEELFSANDEMSITIANLIQQEMVEASTKIVMDAFNILEMPFPGNPQYGEQEFEVDERAWKLVLAQENQPTNHDFETIFDHDGSFKPNKFAREATTARLVLRQETERGKGDFTRKHYKTDLHKARGKYLHCGVVGLLAFGGRVFLADEKTDIENNKKASDDASRKAYGLGGSPMLFRLNVEGDFVQHGSSSYSRDPKYQMRLQDLNAHHLGQMTKALADSVYEAIIKRHAKYPAFDLLAVGSAFKRSVKEGLGKTLPELDSLQSFASYIEVTHFDTTPEVPVEKSGGLLAAPEGDPPPQLSDRSHE